MGEISELMKYGWHLSEKGLDHVKNGERLSLQDIIKRSLDIDIYEIGAKWLPDDISKGKVDSVTDMGVLQINKIRNITAPKSNEESEHAPRMLKLSLSDGHVICHALELERIEKLSLNTPPGTKIKLTSDKILLRQGLLLLDNSNVKVLGGQVTALVEKWKLAKSLANQSAQRVRIGQGGPPPWVPFGKRSSQAQSAAGKSKQEPFRAMDKVNVKKEVKEDGEFEQQRQATIAEVSKSKIDKAKNFAGGSKQSTSSGGYDDNDEYSGRSVGSPPMFGSGGSGGSVPGSSRQYAGGGGIQQGTAAGRNMPPPPTAHSTAGAGAGTQQQGYSNPGGRSGTGTQQPPYSRDSRPDRGGRGGVGRGPDSIDPSAPGAAMAGGHKPAPATLFDFLENKIPPPPVSAGGGGGGSSGQQQQQASRQQQGTVQDVIGNKETQER